MKKLLILAISMLFLGNIKSFSKDIYVTISKNITNIDSLQLNTKVFKIGNSYKSYIRIYTANHIYDYVVLFNSTNNTYILLSIITYDKDFNYITTTYSNKEEEIMPDTYISKLYECVKTLTKL